MEQGMCWIWFGFKEDKYFSENKVTFLFDVLNYNEKYLC